MGDQFEERLQDLKRERDRHKQNGWTKKIDRKKHCNR